MNRQFYVYMMTNENQGTLYVGVSNNLARRVWEHREGVVPGFTSRYRLHKLVWYQVADNAHAAIAREKQLKAGSRKKKEELIKEMNPSWRDLSEDF